MPLLGSAVLHSTSSSVKKREPAFDDDQWQSALPLGKIRQRKGLKIVSPAFGDGACLCLLPSTAVGQTLPLTCVFPLPSWLRHCLSLRALLPSLLRHCLCLAVLRGFAGRARARAGGGGDPGWGGGGTERPGLREGAPSVRPGRQRAGPAEGCAGNATAFRLRVPLSWDFPYNPRTTSPNNPPIGQNPR